MSGRKHPSIIVTTGEYKPGYRWGHRDFELIFSTEGNLELRATGTGKLIWATYTSGATKLAMQEDGNLVVYADGDRPLWAANSQGNRHASLHFQGDGKLIIFSAEGKPVWSASWHQNRAGRPAVS